MRRLPRFSKISMMQEFACGFADKADNDAGGTGSDKGTNDGGTDDAGDNGGTDGGDTGDGGDAGTGKNKDVLTFTPEKFKARLDREKKSILKALGFTDEEEAKRILGEDKKRREANMTELDKTKKELKDKTDALDAQTRKTAEMELQMALDKGARRAECTEDDDVVATKWSAWAKENLEEGKSPTAQQIDEFYADLKKKKPAWFKATEKGADTGTGKSGTPPGGGKQATPKAVKDMNNAEWHEYKKTKGMI